MAAGVWINRSTGQQVRGVSTGPKPRAGLDIDWFFTAEGARTGVWINRATGQQVRGVSTGPKPRAGLDIDWSFRAGPVVPTPISRPVPPRTIGFTRAARLRQTEATMLIPEFGVRRRLGDERGFVHKRLLGGLSKVAGLLPIPGPVGGLISTVASRLAGTRPPSRTGARPSLITEDEKQRGIRFKFNGDRPPSFGGGGGGCNPPLIWDSARGFCVAPTSPLGASTFGGEATMGQYGAALIPGSQIVDRATCPRGTQLGNDGLCYNKGQIKNNQRMWPAGRKPLLTGGDMRAISTAARAGRRMNLATKRLQKMGMMKKPAARRVPAGHRAKLVHASDQ